MWLRMSEKWVDYLKTQPDTRPGCQDTDWILKDGRRYFCIDIYDHEWADMYDDTIDDSMIEYIEVYGQGDRDIKNLSL